MFYNEWQKEVSPLAPLLLIDSVIALMATAAAMAMAVVSAAPVAMVAAADNLPTYNKKRGCPFGGILFYSIYKVFGNQSKLIGNFVDGRCYTTMALSNRGGGGVYPCEKVVSIRERNSRWGAVPASLSRAVARLR